MRVKSRQRTPQLWYCMRGSNWRPSSCRTNPLPPLPLLPHCCGFPIIITWSKLTFLVWEWKTEKFRLLKGSAQVNQEQNSRLLNSTQICLSVFLFVYRGDLFQLYYCLPKRKQDDDNSIFPLLTVSACKHMIKYSKWCWGYFLLWVTYTSSVLLIKKKQPRLLFWHVDIDIGEFFFQDK